MENDKSYETYSETYEKHLKKHGLNKLGIDSFYFLQRVGGREFESIVNLTHIPRSLAPKSY